MEAIINKSRIWETIEVDDELCADCGYSKITIEEEGPDLGCRATDPDECHRVNNVVEDVKAFVEDNIDMLQFIELKNEEK